ncbi:MAG: hypothetical protein IPK82_22640 [Polyangiaceae bacterium]|nr:hypothetical protein [Polyangiaceae bacterium]
MAFVVHARCEHGGLVHVESPAPTVNPTPRSRDLSASSTSSAAPDEHEHCVIDTASGAGLRFAFEGRRQPGASPLSSIADLPQSRGALSASPPAAQIKLLFLSPKSSPPEFPRSALTA